MSSRLSWVPWNLQIPIDNPYLSTQRKVRNFLAGQTCTSLVKPRSSQFIRRSVTAGIVMNSHIDNEPVNRSIQDDDPFPRSKCLHTKHWRQRRISLDHTRRWGLSLILYKCRNSRPTIGKQSQRSQPPSTRTIDQVSLVRTCVVPLRKPKLSADRYRNNRPQRLEHVVIHRRLRPSPLARDRLSASTDRFLPAWNTAIARLFAFYVLDDSGGNDNIQWRFEYEDFIKRRRKAICRNSAPLKPEVIWLELPPRLQRRYWMSALLYAQSQKPSLTHTILKTVMTRYRMMPQYMARDCISLSIERLLNIRSIQSPKQTRPDIAGLCYEISRHFFEHYIRRSEKAFLTSRVVNLLMSCLSSNDSLHIQKLILTANAHVALDIIQHSAYRAVHDERPELAMKWLSLLKPREINYPQFRALCVTLLGYRFSSGNVYLFRTNILYMLLELGLKPDSNIRNVIINNAMEGGDTKTAWSSHHIMKESGLHPTAFTYTALLKGVRHGDRFETIANLYREAQMDGLLHSSPRLASYFVHAIWHLNMFRSYKRPFNDMLKMYATLFDLSPLKQIGIARGTSQNTPKNVIPMQPDHNALLVMITAWVEENKDSPSLPHVYKAFLSEVQNRKSRIAIAGHYIESFNSFLLGFCRRGDSLQQCLSIIQYLEYQDTAEILPFKKSGLEYASVQLETDLEAALNRGAENPNSAQYWEVSPPLNAEQSFYHVQHVTNETGCKISAKMFEKIQIPKPNVVSWNILLRAYMQAQIPQGAEKIIDIMQGRGIRPSDITWDTLIGGYARVQDIENVARSLGRKLAAGFDINESSRRSLSRLIDREALQEALRRNLA